MSLLVENATIVLGLLNLKLINTTLATVLLEDFVILLNVTAPGLPAWVTFGIYAEGFVKVVNGTYIYTNATLYFDREVDASPCPPVRVGEVYVLTPQEGWVVVGRGGSECTYLVLILPNRVEVHGRPLATPDERRRNELYSLPLAALALLLPLVIARALKV